MRSRSRSKLTSKASHTSTPLEAMNEHQHQVRVVAYCHKRGLLVFAIPNGGKRTQAQGMWLRDEGLASGVPDLFLPMPRNGKPGLFIEMKALTGQLTDNQRFWIDQLQQQGYAVACCKGYPAAIKVIEEYFGEPTT